MVIVPACEVASVSDIGLRFLKACSALSAWAETPESASEQPVQRVRREAGKHISTSPCSMRHAIHAFLPRVHEFTWGQSSRWQFSGAARKSCCGAEIWCDVNCSKRTAEIDWVVTGAEIFHSSVMTFGSVRYMAEDAVNNVLIIILCSSEGFGLIHSSWIISCKQAKEATYMPQRQFIGHLKSKPITRRFSICQAGRKVCKGRLWIGGWYCTRPLYGLKRRRRVFRNRIADMKGFRMLLRVKNPVR